MRQQGGASAGKCLRAGRRPLPEHRVSQAHCLQVSVLADTSYNALSVDEVAAQHAQADCVVTFQAHTRYAKPILLAIVSPQEKKQEEKHQS